MPLQVRVFEGYANPPASLGFRPFRDRCSMDGVSGKIESVSVLAAGTGAGKRLEMVRGHDGFLSITLDGATCPGCRWPAAGIEQCVSLYLTLLRNQTERSRE